MSQKHTRTYTASHLTYEISNVIYYTMLYDIILSLSTYSQLKIKTQSSHINTHSNSKYVN